MSWLMGHLIGDYLLQNDWMALGKKRSSFICSVHCLIWSLTVMLCARWPVWTLPVLFVGHFAQDRTNVVVWYMKFKGGAEFTKPPMAPWSIIVTDNVMHMVLLWAISFLVK